METNESILSREVVSIDDRKRIGRMKDICVDCETRSISHYIVTNAVTKSSLVLPFEKSLSVGDSFMTIQSHEDFISVTSEEARRAITEGYRLVGTEVFSRAGNRLGTVENFEFDPAYGLVTKITLGKRKAFTAESFVFFSPEFVFVDDGETTAQDLRNAPKSKAKKKRIAKATSQSSDELSAEEAVSAEEESEGKMFEAVSTAVAEEAAEAQETLEISDTEAESVEELATEAEMADVEEVENTEEAAEDKSEDEEESVDEEESIDEDEADKEHDLEGSSSESADEKSAAGKDEAQALKEFLINMTVNSDVASEDGSFVIKKGSELTAELIDQAEKQDMLLLLTMSVDA